MLSSSIVMTKANEYYENFSRKLTRNDEVLTDEKSTIAPLLKALKFAAEKHPRQRRKDSDASPYVDHLIDIAQILACVADVTDLTTLQAILHNSVEDTQTSLQELEEVFGQEVRLVIEEVTDDKPLPKPERKRLQIERAPHLSTAGKLIKIADKISNARDVIYFTYSPPTQWSLQRRREYLNWTEGVVFGCRGCNEALEDLYDRTLAAGRQILTQLGDQT
jgi:(p)ppGpp synthase/HD superfamily hydrolase